MRMIDLIGPVGAGFFAIMFRQLADWKRRRAEMRDKAVADYAAGVQAHWFNERANQRLYDSAMWRIRRDEMASYRR